MQTALAWALLIGATESAWRWRVRSRARAWQLTALTLLFLPRAQSSPTRRRPGIHRWTLPLGLVLAVAGYPLGRALAGDHPTTPPQDTLFADLLGLSLLAVAEERTWGARVEPVAGPVITAILFVIKHPLLDHRWRRSVGLALFWTGLALVRQNSPNTALCLHVGANATGVLLGHARHLDQF